MILGLCVPPDFICDNTNDCGDFSDEHNCDSFAPICTLEDGQPCYWNEEQVEDDIGQWPKQHKSSVIIIDTVS